MKIFPNTLKNRYFINDIEIKAKERICSKQEEEKAKNKIEELSKQKERGKNEETKNGKQVWLINIYQCRILNVLK